ncbi:MAG: phosphate propanoyltransferase [Treponema sp.]|jgi:putative phosphotransacetylase|nr:phosphate propanoyltransferase [Treponema sp.]
MDEATLKQLVRNVVLANFAREGALYLPVAVSARHVHLSRGDFETLFGKGAAMTRYRNLSQPGQFACAETVAVHGPKGSIGKVRVLGPERPVSQVEVSISDGYVLGITPLIRMSGNTAGSPGCTLQGPAGTVELGEGVIVAARHVHMSDGQAAAYGVKNGDVVSIRTPAPRAGIIGGITVRCGEGHDLEVHLDTDEANGNGILFGTILPALIGRAEERKEESRGEPEAKPRAATHPKNVFDLITEKDINKAILHGETSLYCAAKGFISPAAADRAKEKGIAICRLQG